MILTIIPGQIRDFPQNEWGRFQELINIYNKNRPKNVLKERYYDGAIRLADVNLGIALPDNMGGLEIGCEWGTKTVDVLASRSRFDGFVGLDGADVAELEGIAKKNNLIFEYSKACKDELKFGCTFCTVGKAENGVKIRFHSPKTAAARWSGEKGRIDCGFAIIDTVPDNETELTWSPSLIYYYTDSAVWVIKRTDTGNWYAQEYPHKMGRPLMEALVYDATSNKPFGRGRLKFPIRNFINSFVRTVANATIGLEFATSPQKYILGASEKMVKTIISDKFKQYVGSIIAATDNPETGNRPDFGQLAQGSITPHVEMLRLLATQFSAATGLSITDTGVINDANPSSSDAILAQSQTLVAYAEQLNEGNGQTLTTIALMSLAIYHNTSLDGLSEEQKAIAPHFKNAAMPSLAITTDAAIKIASAREGFAETDTFLEMIGFDQAEIRRIKAQEALARGLAVFGEIE